VNINATLIGQSISFLFFVWFCMKFVWPVIIAAMEEREEKIAHGLQAADRAEKDLELAQDAAGHKLREAKEQAAAIVEQANKRANQIVDEAKELAKTEGDRLKSAANAEIEQEVNRAKEVLRAQVATLAITGAEKILQQSVDANAHQQLLSELAEQL